MASVSPARTENVLAEPAIAKACAFPILASEALGTCLLVATVVGSGIMAERLAGGSAALVLLANTLATGAILFVLITAFSAVSGAHFNPAVTLVSLFRRETAATIALAMIAAQFAGALAGTWLAHAMFAEPIWQLSSKLRDGPAQALSEFVATFGLLTTIFCVARHRSDQIAPAVALYIVAAYWFTASTSFANPAVTLARMLSDSFAGIAPSSVPAFLAAQLLGAAAATIFDGTVFIRR